MRSAVFPRLGAVERGLIPDDQQRPRPLPQPLAQELADLLVHCAMAAASRWRARGIGVWTLPPICPRRRLPLASYSTERV